MRIEKELQMEYFLLLMSLVLRIALDKKEFAEINDSLRRIILMGRSGQHSYYQSGIAKVPETSVLG